MAIPPLPLPARTIYNVALAYFSYAPGVSDSVRDLCTAGFAASSINISQSTAQQQSSSAVQPGEPLQNAIGTHSTLWRLSRALAHDRHRRGADQIKGLNALPSEGANPTCSCFDLKNTLSSMHVPLSVIDLLLRDARRKGVFILVDASDRVHEADRILDGNAGYLRTQYLTALPPASSPF